MELPQQDSTAEMERMMKLQDVLLKAMAKKIRSRRVLRLYKETYYDLNIQHFHEKLQSEHGMQLSYTWCNWRCKEQG